MPRGVYKRTPEMKIGKYERTPEYCAAMSEASRNSAAVKSCHDSQKGVPRSPETCAKISKTLTGKTHSPETCAKMSATRKGVPQSPEHSDAISKALSDVPKSPEHCASLSEAAINSDANKANWDVMRGGNDIVMHHWLYDHGNLSLNTVQMTRSDHTSLHNLLRKFGYEVPHVNVPGEDSSDASDYVL